MLSLANAGSNLFVYPLVQIIEESSQIIGNLLGPFKLMVRFFFIVGMVWNCFKIWIGTIEVKKMAIDTLYKIVLVWILMIAYIPLRNWTISFGTTLGTKMSGGYTTLITEYGTMMLQLKVKMNKAYTVYMLSLIHI